MRLEKIDARSRFTGMMSPRYSSSAARPSTLITERPGGGAPPRTAGRRPATSISTASVRRPRRASASASAAATVVFPTPPLPTTKCSRRSTTDAGTGLLRAPEREDDVRAAEAERVGERGVDLHAPRRVRHVVEVAAGAGLVEVDG